MSEPTNRADRRAARIAWSDRLSKGAPARRSIGPKPVRHARYGITQTHPDGSKTEAREPDGRIIGYSKLGRARLRCGALVLNHPGCNFEPNRN